jgi:hypothetical protein
MTTFTTEDRLIAEKNGSVTINVEPIPFAGLIAITETPKHKELTDEEIWKLWQEHLNDEIPAFARAILKKAQEK